MFSGTCQLCTSTYGSQCLQCDSTGCTVCGTGYSYNPTISICEIVCAANQISVSGSCQLCSSLYSPECTSCDAVSCTSCLTEYFYNTTSLSCQLSSSDPVCGDGVWINTLEACDDGNTFNFDGCDSQCQVEPDYSCLVADRLPSGASFCKFTKDFTINLNYIEKDPSSNIGRAFLTIEPPTFQQWTVEELQKLMSPITVIDQSTGTSSVIPLNSLSFSFQRVNDQNQVELIIDYGPNSIEGTFL